MLLLDSRPEKSSIVLFEKFYCLEPKISISLEIKIFLKQTQSPFFLPLLKFINRLLSTLFY